MIPAIASTEMSNAMARGSSAGTKWPGATTSVTGGRTRTTGPPSESVNVTMTEYVPCADTER